MAARTWKVFLGYYCALTQYWQVYVKTYHPSHTHTHTEIPYESRDKSLTGEGTHLHSCWKRVGGINQVLTRGRARGEFPLHQKPAAGTHLIIICKLRISTFAQCSRLCTSYTIIRGSLLSKWVSSVHTEHSPLTATQKTVLATHCQTKIGRVACDLFTHH